jgi:membrane protease YdiL (CAAX protease family)
VLPRKSWRLENVLSATSTVALAWFISLAAVSVLAAMVRQRGGELPALVPLVAVALGFHGTILVATQRLIRREYRTWREAFGFDLAPGPAVGLALGSLLIVAPAVYGSHAGMGALLRALGQEPTSQSAIDLLVQSHAWGRLAIGVFAVLLAPAAEEVLFRGLFFTTLRDAGFPRLAWIGTAVAFGTIHANLAAFVPLSLFGGYLAWLYWRTGNLLAPVVAHAVFNVIPFVLVTMGWDFPG